MANTTILTTDTNDQRQTKINQLVGGNVCLFATGTHTWNPGEYNRLMGTTAGASPIIYRPDTGGATLRKVASSKTEPIFRDQDNNGSANVHHNVTIDGRVGSSGSTSALTFDGAGIFIESSWQQEHSGWELLYVTAKNFYTGSVIGSPGGRGFWWLNTMSMPGLEIHHNIMQDSNSSGKEGYAFFIHTYPNMDDVNIHDNTFSNVYQPFNITGHSGLTNAPTGFMFHHNEATGLWRSFIEHLGIGWYYINPMFYFNKASGWLANSPVALDTYGLSLVDNRAYGSQTFGNVMDGGRVEMTITNPGSSGLPVGSKTFVRIANESSQYFSYDFGNLYKGCEVGWYATGGGGQYCYGNTFSGNKGDISIAGWVGTNEFATAGKPVFNTTRAADAGSDATATVVCSGGKVTEVNLTSGGTNYKKTLDAAIGAAVCPPKVTIAGDGTGAKVLAWVDPATFMVGGFVILQQGSGYTTATATITRTAVSEPNALNQTSTTDYPIESAGSVPAPDPIEATEPTDGSFLSDNTHLWLNKPMTTNGLGPFEINQSNQSELPNDGNELGIGSSPPYTYSKGIGCHAPAVIEVALGGLSSRFRAEVGVSSEDAVAGEVPNGSGSVVFQIIKDDPENPPVFSTGVLVSGNQPVVIDQDITGWNRMFLMINSNGDNTLDSFVLAFARLIGTSSTPGLRVLVCVTHDIVNKKVIHLYSDNTAESFDTQ